MSKKTLRDRLVSEVVVLDITLKFLKIALMNGYKFEDILVLLLESIIQ